MATPKPTTEDTVVNLNPQLKEFSKPFSPLKEIEEEEKQQKPQPDIVAPDSIPVPLTMTLAEMRAKGMSDVEIQQVIDLQQLALEKPTQRISVPREPERPSLPSGTQYVGQPQPGGITRQRIEIDPITNEFKGAGEYSDLDLKYMRDPQTKMEDVYAILTSKQLQEKRDELAQVDPKRIAEQRQQQSLGPLDVVLSPLATPQSLAFQLATYAGEFLPDPGTFGSDVAKETIALAKDATQVVSGMAFPFRHLLREEGTESTKEAKEKFEQLEEKIEADMYARISTGKLWDSYTSTYQGTAVALIPYGSEFKRARGSEVLDGLISVEEAEELAKAAKAAGDTIAYDYYSMLSSRTGREALGLSMEIAGDPLWFAGVAKGTKVVKVGGETFTVGEDAVKAINAAVDASKGDLQIADAERLVIDALVRNDETAIAELQRLSAKHSESAKIHTDKVDEITKVLNSEEGVKAQAIKEVAEKERLLGEIEKLSGSEKAAASVRKAKESVRAERLAIMDEAQAVTYMENVLAFEAKNAMFYNSRAAQIDKVLEASFEASQVIKTAGAVRFHVPFTKTTYNLPGRTFKINPIQGDTLASITARTGINAPDLARLNNVDEARLAEMIINGERITVGIGGGGLKGLIPEAIISRTQVITDPLRPINLRVISNKVAVDGYDSLSRGEKFAWGMTQQLPTINVKEWSAYPLYFWDQLASFFGTRFYQPYIADRNFKEALLYFQTRGADINKLNSLITTSDKVKIRLQRANPELWNNYQTALGNYNRTIAAHTEKLMARVDRMARIAEEIAKARIATGDPKYAGTSGQKVLDEAALYREQGRAFPPELIPLRDEIISLMQEVARRTGKELEEVKQALQNIARFAAGDVQIARDLADDISRIKKTIGDITEKSQKSVVQVLSQYRQQRKGLEAKVQQIRTLRQEVKVLREQVDSVTDAKSLTGQAQKDYQELFKKMLATQKKLDSITSPRGKPKQNIGVIEKQIKDLNALERQIQASLTRYRKALSDKNISIKSNQMPQVLQQSLLEIRNKQDELRRLQKELTAKQPKLIAERFKVGADQNYTRALQDWEVDLWDDFIELTRPYAQNPELGEQAVMTAMLGVFKRKEALKGDEFVALSERFVGTGKQTSRRKKPKEITAAQKTRLDKLEQQYMSLAAEEKTLAEAIETGMAIRGKQQQIRLNSIRKQMADIEKKVDIIEEQQLYPTVIGQRFMDVPEDLNPLIDELEVLLDSYTELFKKHGFDFIKDPVEIMKIWGVADYVPHLKTTRKFALDSKALAREIEESQITGGTDSIIAQSLMIDAARYRELSGTIGEINALQQFKGTDWTFTMDPKLLAARLMNSSKGVASKELLLTFLRTGVVRQFDNVEDARMAGFVPLVERQLHQSYALDLDILMMGSKGELVGADQARFAEALELYKESKEGPIIPWAKELVNMQKMAKVEQSIGTVRAVQAEALATGNPELIKFLIDGEDILDVQAIHKRISDDNLKARIEYLSKEKTKVDEKITKYTKAGKPVPKTVAKYAEDLAIKLDDTSREYLKEKRRIENAAWREVSDQVNSIISSIRNRAGELPEETRLRGLLAQQAVKTQGIPPLTAGELQQYFNKEQPLIRMYVQETVQESLRSLTAKTFVGDNANSKANKVWNLLTKSNNFWKTRVTIPFVMFHSRNVIGNYMSNILDLGVGGAFNLKTNMTAGQLSTLVDYYATYGSLQKAQKVLSLPKKAGESTFEFYQRKLKAGELSVFLKGDGAFVDLGDGVVRTYDEALKLLTDNGVISGTSNYRLDIDAAENFYLETARRLSLDEAEGRIGRITWDKTKYWLSKGEDVGIVAASMLASGGIPLAMPKGWGSFVARRAENHARAINFIANMKRGKSIQESTEHVQKFLFNYSDLTPRQRDYLRTLSPFFTWTFKNVKLQIEMMQKNPLFYSTFYRLMYQTLPMMDMINEAEEKGYETKSLDKVRRDALDERVKYFPDYKMYRVRVPGSVLGLPTGYDVEGLGLPIESFAEIMQGIQNTIEAGSRSIPYIGGSVDPAADRQKTFEATMARTHWLIKAIYTGISQRDPFYQESLDDPRMRDANDIVNVIETLKRMEEAGIPGMSGLKESIVSMSGVREGKQPYTNDSLYYFDKASLGMVSKYVPPLTAVNRAIREGAMLQDAQMRSLLTFEAKGDRPQVKEALPLYWRFLNATLGIKVKQQATTDYLQYRWNQEQRDIITGKAKSILINPDGVFDDEK